MAFAAKPAADIECDTAHPCLRKPEQGRGFTPYPMDDLG